MKKIVLTGFIIITLIISLLSVYKYFNRCNEWDCSFLSQMLRNYKYSITKEFDKYWDYRIIFDNIKDLNKDNKLSLKELKESIFWDNRNEALNAEKLKWTIISNMYLDSVNNSCFVFKLNINIDDNIKEYFYTNNYLKKYLRFDINNGWVCTEDNDCYFILTEKWILDQEMIYNCE